MADEPRQAQRHRFAAICFQRARRMVRAECLDGQPELLTISSTVLRSVS